MKRRRELYLPFIFFSSLFFIAGCGPVIHYFNADQYTITRDDSVQLRWKVCGNPVLLIHIDTAVAGNPDEAQNEIRNYILVVQKNGKEKSQLIAVNVLPITSSDDIVFSVVRKGDSLVASGEKNTIRWGNHFLLKTVSSGSQRSLNVAHRGTQATLTNDGQPSSAFAGIPNSGDWNIATLMTPEEKKDSSLIPAKLTIHSTIIHSK